MNVITKVIYDVSEAIKNIQKLEKETRKAQEKAQEAFEDGAEGASLFDKALSGLPGKAGQLAGRVQTLVTTFGGVASVGATAAGSLAAIAVQFIDVADATRDSTKALEDFRKATLALQKTRDALSSLSSSGQQREFRLAERSLALQRIQNNRLENQIDDEQSAARNRLNILQEELRERESRLRDSVNKEKSIRDKLNDRVLDRKVTGAANTASAFGSDVAAAQLNEQAREAAAKGQLELAQRLEQEAQKQAANAKNQAFALADQRDTSKAIDNLLIKQARNAKSTTKQHQDSVKALKDQVDQLKELIKLQDRRKLQISTSNRELESQGQDLRLRREDFQDSRQANTAARDFERNARDFQINVQAGGESFKETVLGLAPELFSLLTNAANRNAALTEFAQAGGAARNIAQTLGRDDVTPQEVEALGPDIRSLSQVIARLEANRFRLNTGTQRQLDRLNSLLESAQGAVGAAAEFRTVRRGDQVIREGSTGFTDKELINLRKSILGLDSTLKGESRTRAALPQSDAQQQTTQGAPRQVQSGASNITVNANVRGGIVDTEVTQKIVEIVRRELRKQTSPSL